ncbi:MAG: redoxin domain-containing protein [Deltaproteobacteria bacterium]|nr:redoxin domain-containing protein [Deltaproteobacteria bacterium]
MNNLHRKTGLDCLFRFVSCPLCNIRLQELAGEWTDLSNDDVEMFRVYQSPPKSIREWVTDQRPNARIIPDPEMTLYAQFSVEKSIKGFLHPEPIRQIIQAKREKRSLSGPKGCLSGPKEGPRTRVPADFLIDKGGRIHQA